jgi:hypothetical protein
MRENPQKIFSTRFFKSSKNLKIHGDNAQN